MPRWSLRSLNISVSARSQQHPPELNLYSAGGRLLLGLPLGKGRLRARRYRLQLAVLASGCAFLAGLEGLCAGLLLCRWRWQPPARPRRLVLVSGRRVWARGELLIWPQGFLRWQALYADELSPTAFLRLRRLLIRLAEAKPGSVAISALDFERV